jgi:hypothetical protein
MSIEKALIAQARPQMLAARLQGVVSIEANKGCCPEVSSTPVALEPRFNPINQVSELLKGKAEPDFIVETLPQIRDLIRLQIWLSPEEKFSWLNSELFLKQLRSVSHRVSFEIIGNSQKIQMQFLVHKRDLPIIQTAFQGQFERCKLTPQLDTLFESMAPETWEDASFLDFFPPPPYSQLLTRSNELKVTTFPALIIALMEIEPPALGFFQALMQPVNPAHNWHLNVQKLLDAEYALKLFSGIQVPQRFLQQAPSGDLHQMSLEVETKAHNDKPFYSLAIRLGVISSGQNAPSHLMALSTFINLFQHGGRSLNCITEKDYKKVLSGNRIMEMFILGATYRPGFLVNSSEAAGFVHVPPAGILEFSQPPLSILETLAVRNDDLYKGTPIGTCEYAGTEHQVCIPNKPHLRSTHIIGKPGQGKSTMMAHMILCDIDEGKGVAVLDPHGDLVDDVLCMIKEEHVEKTIYFDPGHPEYVPLWNPLKRSHGQDISRTADDLVGAIKSVVSGWGDRMEHLLRHGLYALLQLPNSTFLDLSDLLRRKTDDSERLRKEILEVVDNQTAYQFWKNDFDRYSNEALDPPKHKLSKLLVSGTVSLMLSQPENMIDFRQIMDNGMILLVNLSTIGSEVREILGCFILSLFHLTALGRSQIAIEDRKPFHIYADEAHRFLTEAMEDLIAETRKFGVGLTLAHHYLSQFSTKEVDALSSVGTTIIMNVDTKDARRLSKDLQELVQYEDLISLKVGEAIARIGTDIVRCETPGSLKIPKRHFKDAIIERSHRLYYRPAAAIREFINKRDSCRGRSYALLVDTPQKDTGEFIYEEL